MEEKVENLIGIGRIKKTAKPSPKISLPGKAPTGFSH
jgi:hypothetical protein